MKKTVLLIRNAAKSDFGGAETYQISLAKILTKLNYQAIVVTRSKKLLDYARKNRVEAIKGWWWSRQDWSGKRYPLVIFYYIWQIVLTIWYLYAIQKTNASIIHVQSKDDFIAASIAGRILKKRVIWSDHMDLRYVFENISKPLRNPVGKLVYAAARFSDNIILISNNEHSLVTGHFKYKKELSNKITIVNNGVIDRYRDFNPPLRSKVFTYCLASRIVENKGIGEAIEAYLNLESSLPKDTSIKLDIYGDGADLEKFKQRIKGSNTIEFHGHQSHAIEKIAESSVFILPSYQEGFSIALLEATMLGKAIIATDVDSNSEIIKDQESGLLIKVRDPISLEAAMRSLLINPELKHSLEKSARKTYEANFNLEHIVRRQIIPLYED